MTILGLLYLFLIICLSALPLDIAVKMLGGHSSIFRVILANIVVAIIAVIVAWQFGLYAGLVPFLIMIVVYMLMFDLGFFRALIAWFLQFVIIALFIFLLGAFLGITLSLL